LITGLERVAGIGQVVHQQHLAGDLALGRGDVAGDVQVALHRAGVGAVGAGGHDGQRLVKDAAQDVARAHAAARQAQDGVELPARLVHLDGQFSIRLWYSS
jgi:hypothetical protein